MSPPSGEFAQAPKPDPITDGPRRQAAYAEYRARWAEACGRPYPERKK